VTDLMQKKVEPYIFPLPRN